MVSAVPRVRTLRGLFRIYIEMKKRRDVLGATTSCFISPRYSPGSDRAEIAARFDHLLVGSTKTPTRYRARSCC